MNAPLRRFLVAAVGVCALVGAGLAILPSAEAQDGQPLAWGAYPSPRNGESKQAAVQRLEASSGRKLDVVRTFYRWNEAWPTSYETWLRDTDHTLVMSVKTRTTSGAAVTWSSVANAQPGSARYTEMQSWARRVRDFGAPIYVTMNHEPEAGASSDMGTATEFIAAWRKWVSVFRAEGATNVKFMWIVTDYAYMLPSSDRRYAPKWYPGDAYTDGIASDAYNWYNCRPGINTPWWSLEYIVDFQRRFALDHPGKEVWITEYGSAEDTANPARKAQWYADARALFKKPAFAVFRGVSLYEADVNVHTGCAFQPDSSPAAAASWRTWGQDPYYGGPTTPPPPPGDAATLVVGDPSALGSDAAIVNRLTGLGFTVTIADDNTVTPAAVSGADVVLISQTVSTGTMGAKLRTVAKPVLVWKPGVYGAMGLAPTAATASGAYNKTTVAVTAAGHPLAAGRTGNVQVVASSVPLGWGDVASGAVVVATLQGKPALFAYPAGSSMVGLTAPACRVGFPLHSDGTVTADGWALFDRAATYAATNCT